MLFYFVSNTRIKKLKRRKSETKRAKNEKGSMCHSTRRHAAACDCIIQIPASGMPRHGYVVPQHAKAFHNSQIQAYAAV